MISNPPRDRDMTQSGWVTSAITGASAGATVGTIIGPVGTLVGTVVGLIGVPVLLSALKHRSRPHHDADLQPKVD